MMIPELEGGALFKDSLSACPPLIQFETSEHKYDNSISCKVKAESTGHHHHHHH